MAQKAIPSSDILAQQIKLRRNELGLTIEEAASRAGVGTKTWCRYEAGESIRADKCKGVCKALNWRTLPGQNNEDDDSVLSIQDLQEHRAWSPFLADEFGIGAAVAFAVGSDILLDHIKEDMRELASKPVGSHLGQLGVSWLHGELPEQFLTRYDYEFFYRMKCTLKHMIKRAKAGCDMTAHSVMEELILYLCNKEAAVMIELYVGTENQEDDELLFSDEWVFELLDDMDILTYLYSDIYLNTDAMYHFDHWADNVLYE